MEWLTPLAGLIGFIAGAWWMRMQMRFQPAICPCGHVVSVHDQATGPCRAQLNRVGLRCACQFYAGPPTHQTSNFDDDTQGK